jgi:hypothetical protein
MSQIIEKTYELLDTLENSNLIKTLTISKEKLLKDKYLLSLINTYNIETENEKKIKLKQELYSNKVYKDYIDSYNELSYIILKINNKFKEYTNTKNCM